MRAHAITTPARVARRLPTSNEYRILSNLLQELAMAFKATLSALAVAAVANGEFMPSKLHFVPVPHFCVVLQLL